MDPSDCSLPCIIKNWSLGSRSMKDLIATNRLFESDHIPMMIHSRTEILPTSLLFYGKWSVNIPLHSAPFGSYIYIYINLTGDSKWPFDSLVGGHLTFPNGHLTILKRARSQNCQVVILLFSETLQRWTWQTWQHENCFRGRPTAEILQIRCICTPCNGLIKYAQKRENHWSFRKKKNLSRSSRIELSGYKITC